LLKLPIRLFVERLIKYWSRLRFSAQHASEIIVALRAASGGRSARK